MKRVRVGHEPIDPTKIYLSVGKERVDLTPSEAMRMGEALLNEGAALLLTRILVEPREAGEAAMALAALQGAQADADFIAHIEVLLAHFDELGLVLSLAHD